MQSAEFHPQYGDVSMYTDRAGSELMGGKAADPVPDAVPVENCKEDDIAEVKRRKRDSLSNP